MDEKAQKSVLPNEAPIIPASKTPLEILMQSTDVLLMLYPKDIDGTFRKSIRPEDEITVYESVRDRKSRKDELLILLDTGGGNVYSAVKIMDVLRKNYKTIRIAIPQEAKSSGTMMCCGANELIMGGISELGPLDKPLPHPSDETVRISALDIVKSIDGMLDMAAERQMEMAKTISDTYGIPIKTALTTASESVSKLVSPMLCQEDVKIYNQAKRLLSIGETYGAELLNAHMFGYIKEEELRKKITDYVIRRFVWLYPDHAFAIRRDELTELFFKVVPSEKCDYWEDLWKIFRENIGNTEKNIRFL